MQGYAFRFKLHSYRDDALLALPRMSERLYFEEDAEGASILAIVEAEDAGAALATALAQAEILVRLASPGEWWGFGRPPVRVLEREGVIV